jgi:hypothetical protein
MFQWQVAKQPFTRPQINIYENDLIPLIDNFQSVFIRS